ncbi:protein lin-37 homolog isoform X2 [Gallus gallus]|uniref:protein lin-37 homolog isoform X2 n=1 Tax=Gallus gallus TaxID=9031 RepID=UPI001AE787D7|nr:protein lin-37 homolog isoform X2 [Gallus gallus]
MLSLKVKVEKPDLEATSARSRLDAVLQGLLERSEGDREVLEDDAGKAVGDAVPKDASPSAPGKRGQPPLMGQPHISPHRASRRFPPHRRKKRREAEEGQPDPPLQRPRPGCATALRGAPKSAPRRPNPPHICRAQVKLRTFMSCPPRPPPAPPPASPPPSDPTKAPPPRISPWSRPPCRPSSTATWRGGSASGRGGRKRRSGSSSAMAPACASSAASTSASKGPPLPPRPANQRVLFPFAPPSRFLSANRRRSLPLQPRSVGTMSQRSSTRIGWCVKEGGVAWRVYSLKKKRRQRGNESYWWKTGERN